MTVEIATTSSAGHLLAERFQTVRRFSEELAAPLSAEDCALQSMADVSPTKWHLAHTTWFFETFILSEQPGYRAFDKHYAYLFNSYYNSLGKQFPRPKRGLMSRPGLAEILEYRRHVDVQIAELLASRNVSDQRLAHFLEIGLHHEQQHQELMLTDIKHVLSCNPLQPVYREGTFPESRQKNSTDWLEFDEGVYWIGHEGHGFSFDNELPRHREFLESFYLCDQLVTCGEYLRFIEDGGYQRPELWLSLGWDTVVNQGWQAPMYWRQQEDGWYEFTLAGAHKLVPSLPVCHVSYFEADAFARWADARLLTEAEWEVASRDLAIEGNFVDSNWASDLAIHPGGDRRVASMYGDVWQWTASPYVPYPGYTPPDGALGEYNGKFMCNQYVLRGGSCATSSTHVRNTYRNFFPPEARWQFTGIRLCR
ncbi:MAG: ergothioneine biosynthesis protein EgtB [Pirellulales bacterium]|nr:ergothioneine biosynthesis protein EgtB [Pirellulales bacterium]